MNVSLRVLVVDDNRVAADNLATLLKSAGHEIRVACDGNEALAMASEDRFDVLLIDLQMPEMDGLTLAREVQKQSKSRDAVLIAVTGFGDELHQQRSQESGFYDYLVKPVDIGSVLAILEHKRQRRGAG
jgi:CheY-like chemotaxis protein